MIPDDLADLVIDAAHRLAIVIRDEGTAGIQAAARDVVTAAGGSVYVAVGVMAALINTDRPVDAWWQRLPGTDAGLSVCPDLPDADGVDWAVVRRLIGGDHRVESTPAERREAIAALRHLSDSEAALRVGVTERTVSRHRRSIREGAA